MSVGQKYRFGEDHQFKSSCTLSDLQGEKSRTRCYNTFAYCKGKNNPELFYSILHTLLFRILKRRNINTRGGFSLAKLRTFE